MNYVKYSVAIVALLAVLLFSRKSEAQSPTIIRKLGTFSRYGIRKTKPKYIVIHYTLTGNPAGTVRVLQGRDLSTSFEVDEEGNIYEYLDTDSQYPYASGGDNNSKSIAIDFTHTNETDPWPVEQILAGRKLITYLCKKYGIPERVAPEHLRGWTQEDMIAAGYGIARHRNVRATQCPGDLPVEALLNNLV